VFFCYFLRYGVPQKIIKKHPFSPIEKIHVEGMMKFKVNEDWLSVGIALLLIVLALVGLIDPNWMKF
jgi:hypothetical protein